MKFKKCRTLSDIIVDPRVDFVSDERGGGWANDGIWIYLKKPYYNSYLEIATIHEWTVRDCLEQMNDGSIIENEAYWNR